MEKYQSEEVSLRYKLDSLFNRLRTLHRERAALQEEIDHQQKRERELVEGIESALQHMDAGLFGDTYPILKATLAKREANTMPASKKTDELVEFTRRTDYPKLGWLVGELKRNCIRCVVRGHSWHGPITWVHPDDLDGAWDILTPVDSIPDDDEQYQHESYYQDLEEEDDDEHGK